MRLNNECHGHRRQLFTAPCPRRNNEQERQLYEDPKTKMDEMGFISRSEKIST